MPNVRKTKGILWMLNGLAVVGILFVLVTIVKKDRAGEFRSRSSEVFKKKLLSEITANSHGTTRIRDINKYSALWKARIDGSPRKDLSKGGDTEPKPLVPENEPIGNVLEITMLVYAPKDSHESKVCLHYLKEGEVKEVKSIRKKLWSREGDPLSPPYDAPPSKGKILKIEESRVVFSWFGKETALEPKSFVSPADAAMGKTKDHTFPHDPLKKYRKRPPKETLEVKPGEYALSRKEYRLVTEGYDQILKKVSLATYRNPKTGKESIKLGSVGKDSIVARRGFSTGDILISINGIPVSSKAGAINYFKQHPHEGKYTIEIERMGRRVYKTFYYDS